MLRAVLRSCGEGPRVSLTTQACMATLLAHMTGFASINAFGVLQQSDFFRQSWQRSMAVVPLSLLGLTVLNRLFRRVRRRIQRSLHGHFSEEQQHEGKTIWNEETEEAEEDVRSLTVSFLFTQSLRFYLDGNLANAEGGEHWSATTGHSVRSALILSSVGSLFSMLTLGFAMLAYEPSKNGESSSDDDEEHEKEVSILSKVHSSAKNFLIGFESRVMMTFSWTYFFGVRWLLGNLN